MAASVGRLATTKSALFIRSGLPPHPPECRGNVAPEERDAKGDNRLLIDNRMRRLLCANEDMADRGWLGTPSK